MEICRYMPAAQRKAAWEDENGPVPEGMRVGWTCLVPYCFKLEHMELAENLTHGYQHVAHFAKQVKVLAPGQFIEIPTPKFMNRFRAALSQLSGMAALAIRRSRDGSTVKIIRTGDWSEKELADQVAAQFTVEYHPTKIPIWKRPAITWLGQFFFSGMHSEAIPKTKHCKVKACVLPVNGNGKGLCHHHFHFFDRNVSILNSKLDLNDLFAPDGALHPTFYVGWMWQEKDDFNRVKFEHKGSWDRGSKLSSDWWSTNVTAAFDLLKRPASVNENLQGTGAFKLRGWGKRKIRKVQRMRPAGWHGNHPEQKPIKVNRETLDQVPQWAPPVAEIAEPVYERYEPIYPLAQSYEVLEPDLTEEEERDALIASLANEEFFDQRGT